MKAFQHFTLSTCLVSLFLSINVNSVFPQAQAKRANDFMESFGISGLKVEQYSSGQMPHVKQRVSDLKVRYARNRVQTNSTYINRQYQFYEELGIKWLLNYATMGLSPTQGVHHLKNNYPTLNMLLAIEGLNEPFGFSPGFEASEYFDHQEDIFNLFKNDPDLQHIPVVSISVAHRHRYELLGDMREISDIGNLHSYPTTTLHPGGGLLESWVQSADAASHAGQQYWTTEAGYHDNESEGGTPSDVHAKYLPRMLFYYFLNERVDKLFYYRLVDQATDIRSKWWGICRNDATVTPKPAFTAWKNTNTILDDTDSSFTPGVLNYLLTGDINNIKQVLLQKGDSTYYLIVWQEVRNWHSEGTEYKYPDRQLTLSFGSPVSNIKTYLPSFNSGTWPYEGYGTSPKDTYSDVHSISLAVPDHIMIIEISGVTENGGIIVPVNGVFISHPVKELEMNETTELKETITPWNATYKQVHWSSADSTIATVDSNGLVKAVSAGNTVITVTTLDGGFSAHCNVTVSAPTSVQQVKNIIQIYPNPASGNFVTIQSAKNSQIKLFDISGRTIYSDAITDNIHHIDIQNFSSGLYYLKIQNESKAVNNVLIVK